MTLADPTGGAGYLSGAILPSSHMTTIATNQPKAVDGNGGGTWTPSASIILNGSSALQLGGKLKYTSRSVTRYQPLVMSALATNWAWAEAANGTVWKNATTNKTCVHELPYLAHNARIDSIDISYQGGPGHMGQPTLPTFRLFRVNASNTYAPLTVAFSTTWVNVATYEAAHTASISSINHTVDLTAWRYVILINAEAGGFGLANGLYLNASVTMTLTEQAEV